MSVDFYASRAEEHGLTHNDILALSADARLEHPRTLASRALRRSLVVFVGAMAKGPDDFANGATEHEISLSEFPLSASAVLAKVRVFVFHAIYCSPEAGRRSRSQRPLRALRCTLGAEASALESLTESYDFISSFVARSRTCMGSSDAEGLTPVLRSCPRSQPSRVVADRHVAEAGGAFDVFGHRIGHFLCGEGERQRQAEAWYACSIAHPGRDHPSPIRRSYPPRAQSSSTSSSGGS